MRCANCNTDNATDSRFCVGCGTALPKVCQSCLHTNKSDARFCAQCGAPLLSVSPALSKSHADEGELKQISVLFADVAGSTGLIEALDPEEASTRLAPAIEAMKDAVRRFEGSVVRVQGDGIMALFGAPNPQEDHAVRACCAALAMQEAVKALPGSSLPVRVGIHSGEVLAHTVATDFSTDFDASGVTVHIASRLEALAPESGIAISAATLRRARAFVTTTPFGQHAVRGLSAPLDVFLLTALRHAPTSERFKSERERSEFVGREDELVLLERGLERAAEAEGCAIGFVAEAGVGKSRLCFEFAERCRARGVIVLEGRAMAHSRATPFAPVVDVLKDYCRILPADTPEEAREKVTQRLLDVDPQLLSERGLMLDFLGLAEIPANPKIDPAARRERLVTLFRHLVRAAGIAETAVVVLEDLHFMDSGSESLIEVLVEALPGTKVLLLVNYRPGYAAPWMQVDYYDQISLTSLRQSAADSLAQQLLGEDESVATLLPLIRERARGNPLFIEELVRTFEESGHLAGERGAYRLSRKPEMRLVPDTVQAIIGARIDSRPEGEKSILQTAAVIGREFAVPILLRVLGDLGEGLMTALHRLSAAGLVYEAGGPREGVFAFRHPMVHDVAYRSLLSRRRRTLHASIASELEKSLPDPSGAQAGFIAYHWEEAGNPMNAASYNMKAANWYGTRDPAQALEAWKRVRRLLMTLPLEGQARYPLLMANGQIVNLAWREGLTAADVEPHFHDALEIARSMEDMRAVTLLTAAYGRVLAASGSALDYVATVSDVISQLEEKHDASLKIVLTAILCHALRLAGDLPRALEANDRALARVHDVAPSDQQTLGFNVSVWVKGMRGQILAMMARFDEARPLLDELIAGDELTVDVLHRLLAHATHADIAWGLNDAAVASQHSDTVMQLAERSGNPYLIVYARGYVGLAQGMRGEYAEATITLSEALAYARRRNVGLENEARLLGNLAHVQLEAGLRERAKTTAEGAAIAARRRGQKIWQAYSERLTSGPHSPAFLKLVGETGAELLKHLQGKFLSEASECDE